MDRAWTIASIYQQLAALEVIRTDDGQPLENCSDDELVPGARSERYWLR